MGILSLFCYECGEIIGDCTHDQMSDFVKNGVECEFCKTRKRFRYCYYPHFSINDFIKTTNKLYEQNKKDLTEEINSAYKLFNKDKDANENFTLEDYTKIYHVLDHLLEDEVKYSIDNKSKVYDNLEDVLVQMYPIKLATRIVNSFHFINTSYRKPIVILIASTIELLFNTYYESAYEFQKFPKNNTTSIHYKIIHLDSHRTESLEHCMNKYDNNFYNLWRDLIKKRNKIIHYNSLYISNKMVEEYMKLLNMSVTIFMNITSELYREHYNSKYPHIGKN